MIPQFVSSLLTSATGTVSAWLDSAKAWVVANKVVVIFVVGGFVLGVVLS